MRQFVTACAVVLSSSVLPAQQPGAPPAAAAMRSFIASADVAALIAKAKAERKEGQALVIQSLLQLAPYNVSLEYRVAGTHAAAVHTRDAELFYVIDGSATLVTGGQLVWQSGQSGTNAANVTGTSIEGGTSRHVAKGDFVMVPEGTPHWFSAIDGSVVLMSLHLPRPPR